MREQRRAFVAMLQVGVTSLDRPDGLVPAIQQPGARHARSGVAARDYDTVGEALLWTLQEMLGPECTPTMSDAWRTAYDFLATTMQRAARSASVLGGVHH